MNFLQFHGFFSLGTADYALRLPGDFYHKDQQESMYFDTKLTRSGDVFPGNVSVSFCERFTTLRGADMRLKFENIIPMLFLFCLSGCDAGTKTVDSCGDGFVDPGEECDGSQMTVATCMELGYYAQGDLLTCKADCTFDLSVCTGGRCGDGTIQSIHGEQCDGSNLDGRTCQSEGYYGGQLACRGDCRQLDFTDCVSAGRCGDGQIQGTESCDGVDLGEATCESLGLGFSGGNLTCGQNCAFDTGGCIVAVLCGNGAVDGSEECDGSNLDGRFCGSLPEAYYGGTLACNGNCTFDKSSCISAGRCGDGILQAGFEECDGNQLGSSTCLLEGFRGGALSCASACSYDVSACFQNFSAISIGGYHSCAIATDSTLWCWGWNAFGQLGIGGTTDQHLPVRVGNGTNWSEVTAGDYHTCGRRTDGTLWCWGGNQYRQIGVIGGGTEVPVQVGIATNWSELYAGNNHTCGRKTDGALWCWGDNDAGQIGIGSTVVQNAPVQVGIGTNWSEIRAGYKHTCGRKTDGTLWCWGGNEFGQLGIGGTSQQNSPVQVGAGTNWSEVNPGDWHTCGRKMDGTLWCWGHNDYGQLGNGGTSNQSSPVQVGTGANWSGFEGGIFHTCARRTDGTLWCWGRNGYGQLGIGNTSQQNSPVQVGSSTNWIGVSAGQSYTCARKTDGSSWCWGENLHGGLGIGNTIDQSSPVQVF